MFGLSVIHVKRVVILFCFYLIAWNTSRADHVKCSFVFDFFYKLCQILTDSKNFYTARKRMKFATKLIWHSHLTFGMLLQYFGKLKIQISADIHPIWTKMQAYCILIASNFVTRPQILIFSGLKMGCLSPYWLQIKFSFHCSFGYLLSRSVRCTGNWSQHTSLQCLSAVSMVFSDVDKILIKSCIWKGNTVKRLTDEFPKKRWTNCSVNKLLKCCGTQAQLTFDRRPEIWIFNFPR